MLKSLHIVLAYLTVIGFVVRGMWSIFGFTDAQSEMGENCAACD